MNILNNKDARKILEQINDQWGCDIKEWVKQYTLARTEKGKVYIVTRKIHALDTQSMRINSLGLYVFNIRDHKIRLTIEGSQKVGPLATKNIVEISDDEAAKWIRGNDLEKDCPDCSGTVIIKHKNGFLGSGPYKKAEKIILNYVAKVRRITSESKTP